jgi:hypothetical protein
VSDCFDEVDEETWKALIGAYVTGVDLDRASAAMYDETLDCLD